MGHLAKRQLDGELKSSLIFEYLPIHAGGILSGYDEAIPTPVEEGAVFEAGKTSAIYVRHKINPFTDFCARVFIYFGFTQSGTSVLPVNFEIRHRLIPLGATPVDVGPTAFSLIPGGHDKYQNTYELISQTYPLKVETVSRNSILRFEIARLDTDTNPDDISLLDVNFLIVPTYVDLSHLTLYPAAPSCTYTVPGILSNRGELLSRDNTQDVAVAPPGVFPRVLTYTDSGATGIEWVDPSVFTGTNKLYSGTTLIASESMTAAQTDLIHKVNNTSAAAITLDLPDPGTLANGNFLSFQLMSTNTDPVIIAPSGGGDNLYDLTGGSVANITLSTVGETAEIITDGTDWFVYNIYEEPGTGSGTSEKTKEFIVTGGGGPYVNYSVDALEATLPPRYMFVNGIQAQDTSPSADFLLSTTTFANDTFTWQDRIFQLNDGDEIKIIYNT
jgi:hypothetical protein